MKFIVCFSSIFVLAILLPLQSCHNKKQDYAEAEKQDYSKALEYFDTGTVYGNNKDYDKALEYCKKAIELKPDYAEAYLYIGAIYSSIKQDYSKALEYYIKAIELNPDNAIIYLCIGEIYYIKQDYGKALEYYNKAIELNPDDAMSYNKIGEIYDVKQDYDKAIEYFEKAVELKSDYEDARFNMKLAYKQKNDKKECKLAQQNTIATADTSRSKEDIMQVVNACMHDLKNIYENYLKKKPSFSGKIMLKFTIVPSGDIISISIMSSTTDYPEFDEFIKNTVGMWKWKTIKSGNTTPTIPFNFSE
jgi:tetratricopeptide (TPR) repeat protein